MYRSSKYDHSSSYSIPPPPQGYSTHIQVDHNGVSISHPHRQDNNHLQRNGSGQGRNSGYPYNRAEQRHLEMGYQDPRYSPYPFASRSRHVQTVPERSITEMDPDPFDSDSLLSRTTTRPRSVPSPSLLNERIPTRAEQTSLVKARAEIAKLQKENLLLKKKLELSALQLAEAKVSALKVSSVEKKGGGERKIVESEDESPVKIKPEKK